MCMFTGLYTCDPQASLVENRMKRDPEEYAIEPSVPEEARISDHIMWLILGARTTSDRE